MIRLCQYARLERITRTSVALGAFFGLAFAVLAAHVARYVLWWLA